MPRMTDHHRQHVANPVTLFQELGGPIAHQTTLHHYGNPVAQGIGLLHVMGGQKDGSDKKIGLEICFG